MESTKIGSYLGRWSQERKLWGADVDRQGADVKPANENRSVVLLRQPVNLHTQKQNKDKPFGEEFQRLQGSGVQGENTYLYRHHWRGRILQSERFYLKQTESKLLLKLQANRIDLMLDRRVNVLPTLLSLTGVAPNSRGLDVSTGSLGHLSRQKKLLLILILKLRNYQIKLQQSTCKLACLFGTAIESRAQQPVCCLQAKMRRKSLGGGNAATLKDLKGWKRTLNSSQFSLFTIAFEAVSHLLQTIWANRVVHILVRTQTPPPPADRHITC